MAVLYAYIPLNWVLQGGRRLTHRIFASLKQDQEAGMASIGGTIEAELTGGNVQE